MFLSNSFRDHLIRLSELNEAGNENLQLYRDAADPNIFDRKERVHYLTLDKDALVLVANGKGGMRMVHSITNLGGNFFRPDDKIVCLQGTSNSATPLLLDMTSLNQTVSFEAPKLDDFLECKTIEDVSNLKSIKKNKFECLQYTILAPYQAKAILRSESTDPREWFLAAKKAAEDFDESKEELVNSATHHNKNLFSILWGAINNKLVEGSVIVDSDDNELRAFQTKRLSECILPAIPAGGPTVQSNASESTLNQLSAAISNMVETNERANALRALEIERVKENDESKKDRIKKWMHETTIRMFKNASSSDGIRHAEDLTDEFKRFFNSESVGAAGKQLIYDLANLGSEGAVICEGALHAMYHGDFVPVIAGAVGRLSPFSFSASSYLKSSQNDNFTMIHLMNTTNRPMTREQIQSSMKQTVLAPKTYHEMMESAEIFGHILVLFTGSESKISVIWNLVVSKLRRCKIQIEQMYFQDKDICAKIMYGLDIQCQQWLRECLACEDREDVDDSYLDFGPIIRSIELQTLSISLPAQFKVLKLGGDNNEIADELSRNGGGGGDGGGGGNRNGKRKREGEDRRVKNENQFEAFKLQENEDYKIFTGKDNVKARPRFNNKSRICNKWNIKGMCFNDCAHKDSHVPHSEYSQQQKDDFLKWMTQCCQANQS